MVQGSVQFVIQTMFSINQDMIDMVSYLAKGKKKSQVAMNIMLPLKFFSGLNTLPSGGDLDEDTILRDASILIQSNDFDGLGNGGSGIKGETSIDLC